MVSRRCILASAIFFTVAAIACQDCTDAHDAVSGGGTPMPGASSGPGGQTTSGAGAAPIFPDPNGFAQALVVDAMHGSTPVNTTQFGHILEDINHSCEGGLYANMLRNADMKEGNANPPQSWSLYAANGGTGNIALDTSNPVNANQASALHLTIGQNGAGQRVGVSNAGFYGIGLRPSTSYAVSFYARTSTTLSGPLHVDLEDGNGAIWATAQVAAPGTAWQQFNTTLVTSASTPTASDYVFVISADGAGGGASLWFNSVECLAPTAPGTNLRSDLVASLKATHPGYFRIPGGNYLEGLTVATRFNWKATVGPLVGRPGHQDDAWGYWSTDGMRLLSYLELAEQTGAEPILAVYAGYNLNGSSIPQSALAPYVQDALDEIEYVMGDANTPWGAQRAADGHPAPFTLNYVEIGNEDFFDSTDSYNTYRFPMFYDAIRAAYPNLVLIATRTDVTSRVVDVFDNHTYENDPKTFVSLQRIYNDTPRRGPRYMEGEYASIDVSDSNPLGTLAGAIGEAAYMTGLENNADVVMGASYAPALANVNSFQWATNLLGFDTLNTYAAPSYYVQQMFGTLKGNYLMPTRPIGLDPNISYVASHAPDGTIYVTVVNPLSSAASMQILVSGSTGVAASGTLTVLTGDPAARNSAAHPNAVPPPQVSTFLASPSFSQTFPPNSVSVLQMRTTGAFVPFLQVGRGYSLGSKSPAYRRETIASEQGSVAMSEVSLSSAGGDKKAATFVLRAGLADPNCYSFEMRSTPGSFILQQNYQLITAPTSSANATASDATFCAVINSNDTPGISWQSQRYPGRFLRPYNGEVWIAQNGGPLPCDSPNGWNDDIIWTTLNPGWWQSDVDIATNANYSFQTLSPNALGNYLRHQSFTGFTTPLTSASATLDRQDATFMLVPGLADPSCYSFESYDFPGYYLRHSSFRIVLSQNTGGLFVDDATFCAQPGNNGKGVTWRSFGYFGHELRNYQGAVWIAFDGGFAAQDTPVGYADDTSWLTEAPLAP